MEHTKRDIYLKIHSTLVEQFEIREDLISLDARLVDDLDIDSIDAVDLFLELKPFTEKKLELDEFQAVTTIGDVVDAVFALAHSINND